MKDEYYSETDGKWYRVTEIAENGFSSATNPDCNIQSIFISKTVETIGANALSCHSIETILVDENNPAYSAKDGNLFNKDTTTLIRYSPAKTETYFIVPSTVTAINGDAFSNNTQCKAIVTTLYDDNAWGATQDAFMLNTYSSGCDVDNIVWDDTVTDENGEATGGYVVHFSSVPENTNTLLFQGQIYPDTQVEMSDFASSIVTNEKTVKFSNALCVEDTSGDHARLYLSGYQKYAFGHITGDKTLEIYNRDSAVLYGGVYLAAAGDEEAKFLHNEDLRQLPSGAEALGKLPANVATTDWTGDKSQIKKVVVKDAIAPSTLTIQVGGENSSDGIDTTWFSRMTNCTEMTLGELDTSSVTRMASIFYRCTKLKSLDVHNFNTSNVENMSFMFARCHELTSLNITDFNTEKVIDMKAMFAYCHVIEALDVSPLDTGNVKNMQSMFLECFKLKSLDLSTFDTRSVNNMSIMFAENQALTNLTLSGFNTENVTKMNRMFENCYQLTKLDISIFNTSNVKDMTNMFKGSHSLKTIIVSNKFTLKWNTTTDTMFKDCSKLEGGNGTTYDSNNVGRAYARIDGVDGKKGYFTAPIHTEHGTTTYTDNADGTHTEYCGVYGEPIKTEAHTYTDGKCVCGKEETTETPAA